MYHCFCPTVYVREPGRTVAYAWVMEQWPAFPECGEVGDVLSAH